MDGGSNRPCRRNKIRNTVVARILDGTYPPGTRLKELALASEFGVSQAPVREALRELEASGLAVSEPFRGTRVLGADSADLGEAYELKAVIEERAAILAVPCEADGLELLGSAFERMRAAASALNFEDYSVASLAFHRGIVEMSGNRAFLRAWDALHWEVRTRIATRRVGAKLPDFAEAHRPVLAALRDGSGEEAGRLLRDMIDRFLTPQLW